MSARSNYEIFSSDLDSFRAALTAENYTLKRALTISRLLSGLGNAYSDEILHAAQPSPHAHAQAAAAESAERADFASTCR
jgi:formamidopyrimidine-DNA glycosylase